MPEYSLMFSQKLSKVAMLVIKNGLGNPEAKRTVLYLSLLSTEISIKAMLEKAGIPKATIRGYSHNLSDLLNALSRCKVKLPVTSRSNRYVSASRLRSCMLSCRAARQLTVGDIIDAESAGASRYPNNIRYGKLPRHYPPEAVAEMATKVCAFAKQHWKNIKK